MDPTARRALHRAATSRPNLRVVDFDPRLDRWMSGASAIVAMGGYNTVSEILSTRTPALIIPRTSPRAEQVVRAQALSAGGHLDHLPSERLDSRILSRWVKNAVEQPRRTRDEIDLGGLAKVGSAVASLLEQRGLRVAS